MGSFDGATNAACVGSVQGWCACWKPTTYRITAAIVIPRHFCIGTATAALPAMMRYLVAAALLSACQAFVAPAPTPRWLAFPRGGGTGILNHPL